MDTSSSPTRAPFKYDALPDATKYIRLLEVLDNQYSENITAYCRITTWPVDNIPSYHAISYTWGDPEPNSTILVNGQTFRVRTNCEFVLQQVYCYKKTSYYWVDAICINQGNLEEKSMQVSMMGNIYKQAAQVLACVGDHADDSAFLVHKLKQHAFTKQLSSAKRLHSTSSDSDLRLSLRFQLGQRFSTTMRFIRALFSFMERPYFTRLWILQELGNAQEATFLCGTDAISSHFIHQMSEGIRHQLKKVRFGSMGKMSPKRLPIFRRFYTLEKFEPTYYVDLPRDQTLMKITTRAWSLFSSRSGIMMLLSAAQQLECQETKDKIFGLLSLIDWGISRPLIPDYTQTEFEVAVSFIDHLLIAWYEGGSQSLKDIPFVGAEVVQTLQLDNSSPGVPSALEARRIEPGMCVANKLTNFGRIHPVHPNLKGWRVSSVHLTKSDLIFSIWSPPGSDKCKVYLPPWVQSGDWIVMTTQPTFSGFVLVREVLDGVGGPLIGHAVPGSFTPAEAPDANFKIYWDPEDLVIHSILQAEMRELGLGTGGYPTKSLRALNTAICRKETPGTSYALRYG